jgi:hypothetical protein
MRDQWRNSVVAVGVYVLVFVFMFYPESVRPSDTVPGIGDALQSAYIIAWENHQILRDPRHLFDAPYFYPARYALALTDPFLLPSLLVAPVLWLSDNPILAYNVCLALACVFAAWAARRLATFLGMPPVAAWATGAFYGFNTFQMFNAVRINIVFHGFFPLVVEQFLLLVTSGRRKPAWILAGLMLLQGLSCTYYLLYGAVLLTVLTVMLAAFRPRWCLRLMPLVPAAIVAGLLYLPVLLPLWSATKIHGLGRPMPTESLLDPRNFLRPSPTNLIYGDRFGSGARLPFLGFVALGLSGTALLARRSGDGGGPLRARTWVPVAAVCALLFACLALGPDIVVGQLRLGPGPYRLLYGVVPGFRLVRFPQRFSVLVLLFLAPLAGRGLTVVWGKGYRLVALVLAVLLPLEHLSRPLETKKWSLYQAPVGQAVPAVYRWLKTQQVTALGEVPTRNALQYRLENLEMYLSAYNFKPTVRGYAAYQPPVNMPLQDLLARLPSEAVVSELGRLGVDTILLHEPPPGTLRVYETISSERRAKAFALHFELQPLAFYQGFRRLVLERRIRQIMVFEGETARIPGGRDIVYRLATS